MGNAFPESETGEGGNTLLHPPAMAKVIVIITIYLTNVAYFVFI